MAEAFVKTPKRDYARVSHRPDAASVLGQLDSWFEHYNSVHPHKALGYRSPREFRKEWVEKTTYNAVGALRRPHEGTTSADWARVKPASRAHRGDTKCLGLTRAQPWTNPKNQALSGYSGQLQVADAADEEHGAEIECLRKRPGRVVSRVIVLPGLARNRHSGSRRSERPLHI
jgi:Integrase core domain